MAEVSKYREARRVLRILDDFARRVVYGPESFDCVSGKDIGDLVMYIDSMLSITDFSEIPELKTCKAALEAYVSDRDKYALYSYGILEKNMNRAIEGAEGVCDQIKPYSKRPNRDVVAAFIADFKHQIAKTDDDSDLILGCELLGKLKSLVPGIDAENAFFGAEDFMDNLYAGMSDHLRRKFMLRKHIGEAMGKVISEYGIGEDELFRSTSMPISPELLKSMKLPSPKEKADRIRTMLGSFVSSDEIALELRELGLELLGIWGDVDLGAEIINTFNQIKSSLPPGNSLKGTVYESKVISQLNEVEAKQRRYRSMN